LFETRVEPTADDLDVARALSSQAAVALRHRELERLRSGALAAARADGCPVAHELRIPWGGLKLFAEYLEERLAKPGTRGSDVGARSAAKWTTWPTWSVRSPSSAGRDRCAGFYQPNGLMESCLVLAQARVTGTEIKVSLALDTALPEAALAPVRSERSSSNLIVNAFEAMSAGEP